MVVFQLEGQCPVCFAHWSARTIRHQVKEISELNCLQDVCELAQNQVRFPRLKVENMLKTTNAVSVGAMPPIDETPGGQVCISTCIQRTCI